MPMSVRGNERAARRAGRGFTLIELLIVIALVALGAGVISLAVRDPAASRLEEEGARLAALLESARAEARAAGLAVRWVPAREGAAATGEQGDEGFRFVGLPASIALPSRWLDARTRAQVPGDSAVLLGPEAILPPQRVVLSLDDRRIEVSTDGLSPFTSGAVDGPAR